MPIRSSTSTRRDDGQCSRGSLETVDQSVEGSGDEYDCSPSSEPVCVRIENMSSDCAVRSNSGTPANEATVELPSLVQANAAMRLSWTASTVTGPEVDLKPALLPAPQGRNASAASILQQNFAQIVPQQGLYPHIKVETEDYTPPEHPYHPAYPPTSSPAVVVSTSSALADPYAATQPVMPMRSAPQPIAPPDLSMMLMRRTLVGPGGPFSPNPSPSSATAAIVGSDANFWSGDLVDKIVTSQDVTTPLGTWQRGSA